MSDSPPNSTSRRQVVLSKQLSSPRALVSALVREENRQIKPLVALLESDQHSVGATNLSVILSGLQTMIVDMSETEKNKMISL
jgi:hypothetical protein